MTNSIVTISIENGGAGYIPGVVNMIGGGGNSFEALFNVTLGGETYGDGIQYELATDRGILNSIEITNHGADYTSDPTPQIYHLGTTTLMTDSITEILFKDVAGVTFEGCR
eukprot:301941-Rhodomonas_salina.1